MPRSESKNQEIERAFKALELVFNTVKGARNSESNTHSVGDPKRVESDLSEIDKAHLALLQSRLQATIAQEELRGMAQTSRENRRFSWLVLALNLLLVACTGVYTWITWQSVRAAREGNQIQQQLLKNQNPVTPPKGTSQSSR